MNAQAPKLSAIRATLPTNSGVYIFRDERDHILYVGKAKRLRSRIQSYFQKNRQLEPRKEPMVEKIADIETIITPTERDALLLEANLIKEHQPPYNIILKDDKFFLYIRVTLSDEFPTVDLVRKVTSKKDAYFGPYASATAARETVKVLKRIFKFRTCTPHQGKACFDYTIGRCLGVCMSEISKSEYGDMIHELLLFLRGHGDAVIKRLRADMQKAARMKKFERAARLRDRVQALEKIVKHQTVISNRKEDIDVLGIAKDGRRASVAILQIRSGKLLYKQTVQLASAIEQSEAESMSAFMSQYYTSTLERPKEVFTEILPQHTSELASALHLNIRRPQRGTKATLTRSAHENAQQALTAYLASFEKDEKQTRNTLKKIQEQFSLARIPVRIESFDVANISGKHAVGAMIAFVDGKPAKNLYKKFSIKTIATPDDPHMLAEIVKRRIERMKLQTPGWEKPDLIILDGGKGQLSITRRTVGHDASLIPIIAMAKGGHAKPTEQAFRETFFLADGRSFQLPATSRELFLLERIRDEAHRFATSFYRKRHIKSQSVSELDHISGIGQKRKKNLLRHFGSLERIKKASEKELTAILGQKLAKKLQTCLKEMN